MVEKRHTVPPEKLCAVSVDIDEVWCYAAIHGLSDQLEKGGTESLSAHAMYDRALPRILDFFAEESIPATFFVIGKDLAREKNQREIKDIHHDGHEIANHTFSHHYDFSRRGALGIEDEIVRGTQVIEQATGAKPLGFRAPGYTVCDDVFRALERLGYQYDSSVFPCPSYYSAKSAAIGWIRLRGRRSHSVVDTPSVLRAPADPYRVGTPYWSTGRGLVEMPIGVTSDLTLRLPFIGTSLCLAGEDGARALSRAISSRAFVNLELHAIDLADAKDDGLGWLAPHQPDLRKTAVAKRNALRAAIGELRTNGYRFVTLGSAASRYAG